MSDGALPHTIPRCAERLAVLDLSENPEISAKSLARLVSYLPQLRVLNLSSMAGATDDLLSILPRSCRHLEKLVLRRCPSITNRGLSALSMLLKLRRLDVSNVAGVTAAGFVSLFGLDHPDESQLPLTASAQALLLESKANMANIAEWSASGSATEPAFQPSAVASSSADSHTHSSISVAASRAVRPAAMSARALELFHNRRRDEWQRHIAAYYEGQQAAIAVMQSQSGKDAAHSCMDRNIGVPISLPGSTNARPLNRHSIRALKATSCDGLDDEAIHAMTFAAALTLQTCSRHHSASSACSDIVAECDAQCRADSSWSK